MCESMCRISSGTGSGITEIPVVEGTVDAGIIEGDCIASINGTGCEGTYCT